MLREQIASVLHKSYCKLPDFDCKQQHNCDPCFVDAVLKALFTPTQLAALDAGKGKLVVVMPGDIYWTKEQLSMPDWSAKYYKDVQEVK